jgi:glycosyltransferase involved in cell wall biosynthesis
MDQNFLEPKHNGSFSVFCPNYNYNESWTKEQKRVIEEDVLKLENNYFSHHLFFPSENSIVLDIDANYGVFSNYFASLGKSIQVIAVESRSDIFNCLTETIKNTNFPNIHCFQSVDDALETVSRLCHGKKQHINLIKMGYFSFDLALLKQITQLFEVGHLCGEFHDNDETATNLYRISARSAGSYYWQNLTKKNQLSGYGNEDIEVSIVVPIYNVERYLPKCIESLINQTIKSKEILLVNDGSTDNSGYISDEWSKKYPEIRVIHQQNAGCAAARSKGLAEARGKFVGFVDSDDWVEAEMFEKLFEAAITHNAELAQCGFQKVYEEDNFIEPVHDITYGVIDNVKEMMPSIPSIWRRLYNTQFLKGKGIDFVCSLPRFDDHPFQFEVFMHASKMVSISDIYYNYRLGRIGQDVSVKDERLFIHFDIFKHLRKVVANNPRIEFERQLKKVEISTHEWALSHIEKRLKRKYQMLAIKDIFHHRLMVSRFTILKDAIRESKIKGLKILVALILSVIIPALSR